MKKFALIGLVIVLSKLSFIYADNSKAAWMESLKGIGTTTALPTTVINSVDITKQLKYLAGRTIYREVPAQNETEFSKEYMNEPYELFSYNKTLMELKDSNKKSIILGRNLWDDGNWKELVGVNVYDLKIGDKVRTTSEYNKNFSDLGVIGKITDIVTVPYPHPLNKVATLDNGMKLDTDWLEKYDTKQKLIIANESNETIYLMVVEEANYYCVGCRKLLYKNLSLSEYYCDHCKKKWDIKEK